METATEIKLDHPVEYGGHRYTAIKIRPPTQEDLAFACRRGRGKFGKAIALIARLSNIDKHLIRELDEVDMLKIEALLDPHLPG